MAVCEVSICIRFDPTGSGPGINASAETLVDELFYQQAKDADDALAHAHSALQSAATLIEERIDTEFDKMMSARARGGV